MASLIGNSDAFTSWSSNIPETINAPTYDDSQATPYIAPTPPPVITNVNTGTITTLDSEFIDQIVRRNQENIYDSTKAQKIPLLTDEHGLAYAKQIDIDLLKVKTRYVTSDNENETHFTQNLKVDELLIRANGGDYKNLWDEIVNHSAHIYAGVQRDDGQDTVIASNTAAIAANNAFMVDTDNSLTQDIDANTANIATNSAQISAILNDIDHNIIPDIGNNMGSIDGHTTTLNDHQVTLDGHTTTLDGHTTTLNDHQVTLASHTASLASQASSINSINVIQTAMDANIYNQISNQVTNRTLSADGTVIRESIDARFNLYGLDTELVVRGEFFGNFTAGANNVKGHIRKAAFHNVDGTSVLHNDITFVMREGDNWKMTRYYWNPSSQTVRLGAGRYGGNTLPEMRYIPDALNNVMPIGDITNTDDLTAEVIHSNFWTHPNANNTGNGQIVQNGVFTYHMRNLVYTPTTERIALKSVQDTILTSLEAITNPPAPYYNYNWFAMEGVGVNPVELRLPENSLIFAGSLYRTRESDNQQTKLIPYLDNQGRLNSGHLWEAEFANQAYAAPNGEKYPHQYLAGLVPAMPIADVNTNLRYEYFLNGEGHWTRNYTDQLNTISTSFTQILNRMEDQITGLVAVNSAGRTTSGGLVTFGDDAAITASPVAIGYVNSLGRLNTARLFDSIFNDQVFGVEDPDTVSTRRKSNAYLSGLVPTAENVADRTTKYLRADGTWSLVPVVDDTKVGNMNIQKGGTDYTFLYHGDTNNYDGIRFGAGGMFQLNSGGGGTPNATMEFRVDNQLYAVFSRTTNDIVFNKSTRFTNDIRWNPSGSAEVSLSTLYTDVETIKSDYDTSAEVDAKISAIPAPVADPKLADFDRNVYDAGANLFMWDLLRINYIAMPDTHFHSQIFWKPTGQGLTNLNVMNDRVNTLITTTNALPDFDAITTSNKFCITNTANGGTISYITPTTSNFNEGSNLYYTDDRVATKITSALQGGEINNIITNQLQAQDFIANSDIRLKDKIIKIDEEDSCSLAVLEPVKYHFKNDDTKRTRYGFIAQDVEEVLPELVHTSTNGIKGINYQDIIALLVKDNQDLRQLYNLLEKRLDKTLQLIGKHPDFRE